jgi:predicted secreted acid phosphatase
VVFYDVDYNLFDYIEDELFAIGISRSGLETLYWMMYSGKAKAVTFSSLSKHISIVIFNVHESKQDYMDSIVHEAEHVKQAMLQAYQVEDEGESPAYTIGYLVGKMWEVFKDLICMKCKYK